MKISDYDKMIQQATLVQEKYGSLVYTAVCGSQNYDCDDDKSDLDTKSIVTLSFEEIIKRKDINKSIRSKSESQQDLIDVKDVHSMFGNLLKANINFIEILSTDYCVISDTFKKELTKLRSLADQCAYYDMKKLINATAGQFYNKYAALKKPSPNRIHLIEKYGYDPKQLASCVRLSYTAANFMKLMPFKRAINLKSHRDEILELKTNPPSLELAIEIIEQEKKYIDSLVASVGQNHINQSTGFADPSSELSTLEELIYRKIFVKAISEAFPS